MPNDKSDKVVEPISLDNLVQDLNSENLIFIGEYHKDRNHLSNEIKIISALSEKRTLQICLEHFDVGVQGILNNYTDDGMPYERLCKELQSKQYGGEYLQFYQPLLEMIRSKNNRILALENKNEIGFEYSGQIIKREKEMARILTDNINNHYLNLVIVGQAHINETALPNHIRTKNKVISHEPTRYLKEICAKKEIKQGIIKVNKQGPVNYLILGRI